PGWAYTIVSTDNDLMTQDTSRRDAAGLRGGGRPVVSRWPDYAPGRPADHGAGFWPAQPGPPPSAPLEAAAIAPTLLGRGVRFGQGTWVAVTGAASPLFIDSRAADPYCPQYVRAGAALAIGPAHQGPAGWHAPVHRSTVHSGR